MLGHSGCIGGKLASDWDISGCGGSGRLIREMKLDWEEGWEERTRKDNRVGEWETEKKSKKKRESDKPLSYKDEQTDRQWRAQIVAQICAVGEVGAEEFHIPESRQSIFG